MTTAAMAGQFQVEAGCGQAGAGGDDDMSDAAERLREQGRSERALPAYMESCLQDLVRELDEREQRENAAFA